MCLAMNKTEFLAFDVPHCRIVFLYAAILKKKVILPRISKCDFEQIGVGDKKLQTSVK